MDDLINNLLENASPPYLANKDWEPGKPVYYSGPYWDNEELAVSIKALLAGKWLPSVKKLISLRGSSLRNLIRSIL